jgi:hypothetical protein
MPTPTMKSERGLLTEPIQPGLLVMQGKAVLKVSPGKEFVALLFSGPEKAMERLFWHGLFLLCVFP